MGCLDHAKLARLDERAFRAAHPFPWAEIDGLITEDAYRRLQAEPPDPERFSANFGRRRRYGQASHDRYVLNYEPGMDLPGPWLELLEELQGESYRRFVARMLGIDRFLLHFHWHYTPQGCSVSPHCDATWKLGSHIFYLNSERDWDRHWGGETLILDDERRFGYNSAPGFDEFPRAYGSAPVGNRSLLFQRTAHSWHGVKPLRCPEGVLRKVFIVEYRAHRPGSWLRRMLKL